MGPMVWPRRKGSTLVEVWHARERGTWPNQLQAASGSICPGTMDGMAVNGLDGSRQHGQRRGWGFGHIQLRIPGLPLFRSSHVHPRAASGQMDATSGAPFQLRRVRTARMSHAPTAARPFRHPSHAILVTTGGAPSPARPSASGVVHLARPPPRPLQQPPKLTAPILPLPRRRPSPPTPAAPSSRRRTSLPSHRPSPRAATTRFSRLLCPRLLHAVALFSWARVNLA